MRRIQINKVEEPFYLNIKKKIEIQYTKFYLKSNKQITYLLFIFVLQASPK